MSFIEDPGVESFLDLDLTQLDVDEAYLLVTNGEPHNLTLYARSHACYGCPLHSLLTVNGESTINITRTTHHPWTFLISPSNASYLPDNTMDGCAVRGAKLGEFGVYLLNVTNGNCSFNTAKSPVFEYGAIIIAMVVYTLLPLLVMGLFAAYRWLHQHYIGIDAEVEGVQVTTPTAAANSNEKVTPSAPSKPRLRSLDTFRGISIVLMIFVNYGAGSYWFLEHADWHGLQLADLVFPWFMWIMGMCIPMGLSSALRRNTPRSTIFLRTLKRSIKLFILGIILNSLGGANDLGTYRIPGVLQRFGICYLVVTSVALIFTSSQPKEYQSDFGIAMKDVLQLLPQWVVHLLILTAHTLITFLMPVPGCPTGYQGPGGIALLQNNTGSPLCIGGAAGEVDRWLLTSDHIYQHPTARYIYESAAFDPEGVLGTLTSIFQVFLGVQAGSILQCHATHSSRLVRWLVWGVMLGLLGAALCGASKNDGVIPLNKNLWSMSFVFVTSSFAFILLSLCYLLVDIWGSWSGAPFLQAGMNSIVLYVGHSVTYNIFPWHYQIGRMNTHLSLLAETLWGTTLWVTIGLYLHHKKKFYTI